jgi:hypothetical protein
MGTRRHRRPRPLRRIKQQQRSHKQGPRSPLRLAAAIFVYVARHVRLTAAAAIAIVGALATAVALYPRFSAQAYDTVIPTPLPLNFTITNDGPLSVNNVKFSCFFKRLTAQGYSLDRAWYKADWTGTSEGSDTMAPSETATVECLTSNKGYNNSPQSSAGDIAVVMDFSTPLMPWSQRRSFRFVNDPSGYQRKWIYQPTPSNYFDLARPTDGQ